MGLFLSSILMAGEGGRRGWREVATGIRESNDRNQARLGKSRF